MSIIKKGILVLILSYVGVLNSQNLISNGNFETGDRTGWDGFNNQVLIDNLTNSKVGNVNNGEGSLLEILSVSPGETYKVTFNYRWVSGNGDYAMTVRVKEGSAAGDDLGALVLEATPDVWHNQATFLFTPPAGEATVRLVFYKVNGNRPLRIDNISVIDQKEVLSSFVDVNTPSNSQPAGVSGDWTLDFSDEFNDTSLNLSKWYKSVSTRSRAPRPNQGVNDWWWVEDNAFLNGAGDLVLRGTKVDANTMYCGSVESRDFYEVQYGYLEARIQIAETSKGNHTAFWLQGKNQGNVDNSAADGAEIDIFESAWNNNTTKAVVHYDGYGSDKKNHTISYNTPNIHNGYHTFGLHWTATTMDIYYDGVKVRSTNAGKPFPFTTKPEVGHPLVPNVPEWLWLSVGASFGDGDFVNQPVGTLSDALVDYVRIYKPSATLGFHEHKINTFDIYPNPIKKLMHIQTTALNYLVTVYNIQGKELFKKKGLKEASKLNMTSYPKGVYLLKINYLDKVLFKKIVR
jgi:hypothetical protein